MMNTSILVTDFIKDMSDFTGLPLKNYILTE